MANVLHRTTFEYKLSVNTPDFPIGTWVINPDLSPVSGVPKKYWKLTGDILSEMSAGEKSVVDDDLTVIESEIGTYVDYMVFIDALETAITNQGGYESLGSDDQKKVALKYFVKGNQIVTVTDIVWQSGTTVRISFSGTPDLSDVYVNDIFGISTASNSSNNGRFIISAVNDASDWIEITNAARTDGSEDETSVSLAATINYVEQNDSLFEASFDFALHVKMLKEAREKRDEAALRLLNDKVNDTSITQGDMNKFRRVSSDLRTRYIRDGMTDFLDWIDNINNYASFAITNANADRDGIEVASDITDRVGLATSFQITDSTGNDGFFSVSSINYKSATDRSAIETAEDLTDNTNDGNIWFGFKGLNFYTSTIEDDLLEIYKNGIY